MKRGAGIARTPFHLQITLRGAFAQIIFAASQSALIR